VRTAEQVIEVEAVPFYFRILDFVLVPLMWVLLGFRLERPQETHKWHMQTIDAALVLPEYALRIEGDDAADWDGRSRHRWGRALHGVRIHTTIFGGWQDYLILEAEGFQRFWHVGWLIDFEDTGYQKSQVQKLQIHSPHIKVLKGTPNLGVTFFALDETGKQLPLRQVAEGRIGDRRFPKIRLF
jgi:hypothetical protein